jgi:flagellar protein FliO/FliZ
MLIDAPVALAAQTSTSFEGTKLNLKGDGLHHASGSGIGGSLVRTIIGLAIVIAVIYGLAWILRQSRGARNQGASGTGLMQVSSLPLGPNRSVALVRVGDELHLLGVAEHGVTSIRTFSEDEAYELGVPFDPPDDGPGAGRTPPLQRVLDGLGRVVGR